MNSQENILFKMTDGSDGQLWKTCTFYLVHVWSDPNAYLILPYSTPHLWFLSFGYASESDSRIHLGDISQKTW